MKCFQIKKSKSKIRGSQWLNLGTEKKLKTEISRLKKMKISNDVWLQASPLQREVWRACQLIPEGCVSTYTDLAVAIGRPKAVRAVASALGKNPVAPKIPCHRVIGQGHLGGYTSKFGLDAKRALLNYEMNEALSPL